MLPERWEDKASYGTVLLLLKTLFKYSLPKEEPTEPSKLLELEENPESIALLISAVDFE